MRWRHLLWVCALALSLALPLLSAARSISVGLGRSQPQTLTLAVPGAGLREVDLVTSAPPPATHAPFRIGRTLALALLALYVLFLLYRGYQLFQAWQRTRILIAGARPIELHEYLEPIVERCQRVIGITRARFLCSDTVPVPLTVGVRHPLVVLPEQLLCEADLDLITSAVGHELMHVWRRDYLLNLIYEFVFLPLAFHPGAALIRRRINQTRELCCDELVAERLLDAGVYARSLVQLAGSAPPLRSLAATTTVGIADADILEVRIMSLLKRSKASLRQNKLLLVAASLVLILPCVAAATLAFHFDIDSGDSRSVIQEPSQQEREAKQKAERESTEPERRKSQEVEDQSLRLRIAAETNPAIRTQLQEELERREEERAKAERAGNVAFSFQGEEHRMRALSELEEKEMKERAERDPQFRAALELRSRQEQEQQEEQEAMNRRQSELVRLAKIPMDQAIQIATSQQPGKVMECSLVGEHWESPGELAKSSLVLYHVVIMPSEGTTPTITLSGRDGQTLIATLSPVHVLINAIDGSVVKTGKEQLREPLNR